MASAQNHDGTVTLVAQGGHDLWTALQLFFQAWGGPAADPPFPEHEGELVWEWNQNCDCHACQKVRETDR
jgi:hypothetical protein